MPELPEIHGMAGVINAHAAGRTFTKCVKSSVTKLALPQVPKHSFTICGQSRGKELLMTLKPLEQGGSLRYIQCNMGMTGYFEAVPRAKQMHKHAHLSFHAEDGSVLSFVDARRFGCWQGLDSPPWEIGVASAMERGPDPVKEHEAFRRTVVDAVAARPSRFANVPICQVMHDQSLFNGIGNYLRAEILFRAGVAPFTAACEALSRVAYKPASGQPDLLTLCRDVPGEVIKLELTKYQGSTPLSTSSWKKWLRVYGHADASWAVDKEGRRIWFHGPPGKLLRAFAKQFALQGARRTKGMIKRPSAATHGKTKVARVAETKRRAGTVVKDRPLKRPASAQAR